MPAPFSILRRLWPIRSAPSPARDDVKRGDAARDRLDWVAAANAYRAAVEADPGLVAICIQLGHALKEQGALLPAIEAYQAAARRQPDSSEPHIFMAHSYKQLGLLDRAIGHFLEALSGGEDAPNEADELLRLLVARGGEDRPAMIAHLRDLIARLPPRPGEAPLLAQLREIVTADMTPPAPAASGGDTAPALVFDISDLIAYYAHARLPTGIQRVQIETIEGALARAGDREIRLCCFIDGRDDWLELPLERMRALARLSTAGGDRLDRAWLDALASLRLFLSLTPGFDFPQGASLINLGTSWWLQNYFLFVRHAKATRGIRYIPFVHDMIPIMAPEHCTRGLTQDFISWVIGVFDHADHFLVNSQATRRDLIAVAETLGHRVDPNDVAVIPLDTDFRKTHISELPAETLGQWGLKSGGFVLFVSTIESRKGHLVAFDAWTELLARLGPDLVPKLVCVGNRGWLNDRIYERLAADPALSDKVMMLSRLTDEELSLLYRTCRFTLYPSLYEGWGLPVTESLCHGKVPLISDAASLPEAGNGFAVFAAAGSVIELANAAERLITDDRHRTAIEARIATEFRARPWSDLAGQIASELDRFAESDSQPGIVASPPKAHLGAWHAISRNEATRIWPGMRTGEAFRSDLGWHSPEARGSRVRREGGEMLIGLDGPHPRLRILFQLVGDDQLPSRWSLQSDETVLHGELGPDERRWLWFEIPADDGDHTVKICFGVQPSDTRPAAAYFVRGFFLHAADDSTARQDFIEAVALGRLDTLNAFRER